MKHVLRAGLPALLAAPLLSCGGDVSGCEDFGEGALEVRVEPGAVVRREIEVVAGAGTTWFVVNGSIYNQPTDLDVPDGLYPADLRLSDDGAVLLVLRGSERRLTGPVGCD